MAKITYDVRNVESRSGEQAPPATYTATVGSARHRTSKANGEPANDIEVRLDLEEYAPVFTYIGLSGASDWKVKEFCTAVGLPMKGSFDTDADGQVKGVQGKKLRVKVNADQYSGEYRARAGTLMPLSEADDDDDDAGSNDDDDDDAGTTSSGEDYSEWSLEELQAEAEERGIEVKGRKTEQKYIDALEAYDAENAGDDDANNDDDAAGGSDPEDDYDEWELSELKDEIVDRKLDMPKGRATKAKLIEVLREDDGSDPFDE